MSDEHGDMLTGDAEIDPNIAEETSKLIRMVERAMSLALMSNPRGT